MPVGSAALPWWVDALLIFIAAVIVITLLFLFSEVLRNIFGGGHHEPQAVPKDDVVKLDVGS